MRRFRSRLRACGLAIALFAPVTAWAGEEVVDQIAVQQLLAVSGDEPKLVFVAESPRGPPAWEGRGGRSGLSGRGSRGPSPLGERPEHHDQDAARKALLDGKTKPLTAILAIVEKRVPGPVMSVELATQGSRLVYQILVLSRDGRKVAVDLDAASGEILRSSDR